MNSNRDRTKHILFVVLALASLSSVAMSAPHRDRILVYAAPLLPDPCFGGNVERVGQYVTAVEWAQGGWVAQTNQSFVCGASTSYNTGQSPTWTGQPWLTSFDASRMDIGAGTWKRVQQDQAATDAGASDASASTSFGAD